MDTLEQFIEKFGSAMDIPDDLTLSGDTELKSLGEWDSLAALGVIVMCDLEYNKSITGRDLEASRTVSDVYALVC